MDIELDFIKNELYNTNNGTACSLARKELLLIEMLLAANGELVGRESLLESCWEGKIVTGSSLNVAIRNIRLALTKCGSSMRIITVPRQGYAIVISDEKENTDFEVIPLSNISKKYNSKMVECCFIITALIIFCFFTYSSIMPYRVDDIRGITVISFGTQIDERYSRVLDYLKQVGGRRVYIMPDVANCGYVQMLATINGSFVDITKEFGVNSCESI